MKVDGDDSEPKQVQQFSEEKKVEGDDSEPGNPLLMSENSVRKTTPVVEKKQVVKPPVKQEKVVEKPKAAEVKPQNKKVMPLKPAPVAQKATSLI